MERRPARASTAAACRAYRTKTGDKADNYNPLCHLKNAAWRLLLKTRAALAGRAKACSGASRTAKLLQLFGCVVNCIFLNLPLVNELLENLINLVKQLCVSFLYGNGIFVCKQLAVKDN